MKCQAKTSEGTACKFSASAEVGGKQFCGNHANKAKATQLKSREQRLGDAIYGKSNPRAKPGYAVSQVGIRLVSELTKLYEQTKRYQTEGDSKESV